MDKKYEMTNESVILNDKTLYRIRALVDFNDVKAGDLGGYIEKEENLSHYGNAWVYDNARVCDNARIYDTKDYCIIIGFGSRLSATTFFRCKHNEIRVNCGCFNGTLEEFRNRIKETRKGKYAEEYFHSYNS